MSKCRQAFSTFLSLSLYTHTHTHTHIHTHTLTIETVCSTHARALTFANVVQRLGLPSSFGLGGRRPSNRGKKRKAAHGQEVVADGGGRVTSGASVVGDSAEEEDGEEEGGVEANEDGRSSKGDTDCKEQGAQ